MARLQIEIKDRKYRSNIAWHVSTILFASSTSLKNFLESNTKPFVKRLKDLIVMFLGLSDLLSIRNYILIPRLVTNWSKTTNHSALSFLGGYQVWFEKRLASEAGDNYVRWNDKNKSCQLWRRSKSRDRLLDRFEGLSFCPINPSDS